MRYLKEILRAIRQRKHLSGPVTLWREYSRWKKLRQARDVYTHQFPWITFWTIDYLNVFLKKNMSVFEYGGGGSTLFFAARVKELVTVEHNEDWFNGLMHEMKSRFDITWHPHLIKPESVENVAGLRRER